MTKFTDEGYIINLRKHGENSLIITILTANHGKVVGYINHALSKKNLAVYQLGNKLAVDAYSRVDNNMLTLKAELITPVSVNFMSDIHKLEVFSALCELCNSCMPEQMPLENFFIYVDNFFNFITGDNWLTHYAFFEFYLLDFLGISLDLSECVATGSTENLQYVSPKSGKAVCARAGEPYKDKLFKFPHFILAQNYSPTSEEIQSLLEMSGFFLQKNFFKTHSLKFPPNRANLLRNLGF